MLHPETNRNPSQPSAKATTHPPTPAAYASPQHKDKSKPPDSQPFAQQRPRSPSHSPKPFASSRVVHGPVGGHTEARRDNNGEEDERARCQWHLITMRAFPSTPACLLGWSKRASRAPRAWRACGRRRIRVSSAICSKDVRDGTNGDVT